ncbi:MAG: hypothetical protein FWC41_09180 [Firmicutes bacterium]|nr:hypothetical protein [Bacillota bacterium]
MDMLSYDESVEQNLPEYLLEDINNVKKALAGENGYANLLHYYWSILSSNINAAQINDRSISPVVAEFLRDKYLWR